MKLFVAMLATSAALVSLVCHHAPAHACATAPPRGAEARVADEEAIIIWDSAQKTETFIRRAQFRSTAKSFGFLVPTPTTPVLGEANESIFRDLANAIRPEVVIDDSGFKVSVGSWVSSCMHSLEKGGSPDSARAPAVRVIQSAHVAGMDATTVEADDPKALADWLGAHGFEATPELTAWLAKYVTDKWKITAFTIGTEQKDGTTFEMATKAVKLTFKTEQPFYPYREPEQPSETKLDLPPRMLRVFFVANERYTGRLGEGPWSASTLYSAPLELPSELWSSKGVNRTTVFIDDASPRIARDEITFVPHSDQQVVKQPPVVINKPRKIMIPLEGIGLVLIVAFLIVRRRGARRS